MNKTKNKWTKLQKEKRITRKEEVYIRSAGMRLTVFKMSSSPFWACIRPSVVLLAVPLCSSSLKLPTTAYVSSAADIFCRTGEASPKCKQRQQMQYSALSAMSGRHDHT